MCPTEVCDAGADTVLDGRRDVAAVIQEGVLSLSVCAAGISVVDNGVRLSDERIYED